MKWNSYVEFVRRNPKLRTIFDDLVHPAMRHSFEHWIEHQVDYIAVRPWASLRLDNNDSHTMRFVVYYHTGEGKVKEVRARSLDDRQSRRQSIGSLMKNIVKQHELVGKIINQKDETIVFDAVVLVHRLGYLNGYRREAFEVFIPPKGFMP